jgi:hypothetical protein
MWFALAFFLAQSILTVHSAAHLDGHPGEDVCVVCLVGSGLDQASVETPPAISINSPCVAPQSSHYPHLASDSAAPFQQRAPPSISLTI